MKKKRLHSIINFGFCIFIGFRLAISLPFPPPLILLLISILKVKKKKITNYLIKYHNLTLYFLSYFNIYLFGYGITTQNFPQFIVIHTVEGFGIVNKAEIDVFLELSCFFDDPADIGNLISGSSAFSKTSLNI